MFSWRQTTSSADIDRAPHDTAPFDTTWSRPWRGRRAQEKAEREARERARSYSIRQQVHEQRGRRRRRDDVVAAIVFVVVVGLATAAQVGFFTAGPGARGAVELRHRVRLRPDAHRDAHGRAEFPLREPDLDRHDDRRHHEALDLARRQEGPAGRRELRRPDRDRLLHGARPAADSPPRASYVLQCGDPNGDGTRRPRLHVRAARERADFRRASTRQARSRWPEAPRRTARAASSSSSTRREAARPRLHRVRDGDRRGCRRSSPRSRARARRTGPRTASRRSPPPRRHRDQMSASSPGAPGQYPHSPR